MQLFSQVGAGVPMSLDLLVVIVIERGKELSQICSLLFVYRRVFWSLLLCLSKN